MYIVLNIRGVIYIKTIQNYSFTCFVFNLKLKILFSKFYSRKLIRIYSNTILQV